MPSSSQLQLKIAAGFLDIRFGEPRAGQMTEKTQPFVAKIVPGKTYHIVFNSDWKFAETKAKDKPNDLSQANLLSIIDNHSIRSLIASKEKTSLVWLASSDNPIIIANDTGGQNPNFGILGWAISSAASSISADIKFSTFLKSIDLSELVGRTFLIPFGEQLKQRGMPLEIISNERFVTTGDVDIENKNKLKILTAISMEKSTRFVLALETRGSGFERIYTLGVGRTTPKAFCANILYLFDVKTMNITPLFAVENVQVAQDNWEETQDYSGLKAALEEVWLKFEKELKERLLSKI
jgi:hypothetical protein